MPHSLFRSHTCSASLDIYVLNGDAHTITTMQYRPSDSHHAHIMCIHAHTYRYIEREREGEIYVYIYNIFIYICIYIYISKEGFHLFVF